jgi:hypothetical protein
LQKIELELDDQVVEALERFASRQNQSAAEFLARGVSNYTRGFLLMALEKWMPRERWEALWRGDGCPLCEAMAAPDPFDATSSTPHLHCHLHPRYYDDFAPNGPLAPLSGRQELPLEELEAQAVRLRTALNAG